MMLSQKTRFHTRQIPPGFALCLAALAIQGSHAGPLACTGELRAVWDEFPHYGEARALSPVARTHHLRGCDIDFRADAAPGKVLDYYKKHLQANGWSLDSHDPSAANILARRGCLSFDVVARARQVRVLLSSAGNIDEVVRLGSVPAPDAGPLGLFLDGAYKTLHELLQSSGLDKRLQNEGPFTLLAPEEDAFKALSDAEMRTLQNDPEAITALLSRHIIPQALDDDAFTRLAAEGSLGVKTLAGTEARLHFDGFADRGARQVRRRRLFGVLPEIGFYLYVRVNDQPAQIRVDEARLSLNMAGPTRACNGFVYMIDRLLARPEC